MCSQFNRFVNLLKKEEENPKEKLIHSKRKIIYKNVLGWMIKMRGNISDKEILDKYINLDNSCLTKAEKKEVRELIHKYKNAFSLRDEIGMCPNFEVEIDVMDKTPFFTRPFNTKEEEKSILDKEMKRLCYLGILKEGFSAYSSPVMLISRQKSSHRF